MVARVQNRDMIAAIAAIVLCTAPADVKTVEVFPSDDVWVYPHASDPGTDPFLRVWGAGGKSVAEAGDDVGEISYSYLRWRLSDLPTGKLVGATLVLTHVANPAFTVEQAKASPLEVRPLPVLAAAATSTTIEFSEKMWSHFLVGQIAPGPGSKNVFASGFAEKIEKDKPLTFELDLLKKEGFAEFYKNPRTMGLGLALTSSMDAAERAVYKLYSKDGPKEYRPYLRLKIETE